MKDNDQSLTKILFWKFTTEKFISEVVLNQLIYDVSYNPKNCLELILCGKGFLRLWNVFINDGSLKEHPQRFLKGKQEKEKGREGEGRRRRETAGKELGKREEKKKKE